MKSAEAVEFITETLQQYSDSPSDELRRLGECLIECATALEGLSNAEGRAVMVAVGQMLDVSRKPQPATKPTQ